MKPAGNTEEFRGIIAIDTHGLSRVVYDMKNTQVEWTCFGVSYKQEDLDLGLYKALLVRTTWLEEDQGALFFDLDNGIECNQKEVLKFAAPKKDSHQSNAELNT